MNTKRSFVRSVRRATWLALGLLGVTATFAPAAVRALVIVLTATIGIAHGATDAATLERAGFRPRGRKVTISIGYGILAIATYVASRRAPQAAARALRILSWAHFGSGDAAFARRCGSGRLELAEAFVRGAVPLCIGGRDANSAWTFVAAGAYAGAAALGDDWADALDVALPAAILYAAPARLGFGTYFAAWHAPRHLALLLDRDPRGGSYAERFGRFARESAPNVAIASAFGALAYAVRGPQTPGEDLATALILGITVPHQVAVWLIEYRSRAEP